MQIKDIAKDYMFLWSRCDGSASDSCFGKVSGIYYVYIYKIMSLGTVIIAVICFEQK